MALRLLEIVVARGRTEEVEQVLDDASFVDHWIVERDGERAVVRVLIHAEAADDVLDALADTIGEDALRVVLLPVEGTRPHPEDEDGAGNDPPSDERIGRDELYDDLSGSARVTPVYIALVALSTIVAATGLLRDDVAAIIGAMVIAPLLGPNVALSLGTTLADWKLARSALVANALGAAVALPLAAAMGFLLNVDSSVREIAVRTDLSLADLGVALAAGGAGALAFTTGVATGIIGVMVAVALLPPLVTAGLLLGDGQLVLASGAGALFVANLICVNLAGVVTFLVRGIRPGTWHEAERARRATLVAVSTWLLLLGLLVAGIVVFG